MTQTMVKQSVLSYLCPCSTRTRARKNPTAALNNSMPPLFITTCNLKDLKAL